MPNWYRVVKLSWRGAYWVFPNGDFIPVWGYHTDAGWEYIKKTEPNPPPRPEGIEAYSPFQERGWIRVSLGMLTSWKPATPAQAKMAAQLVAANGDEIVYLNCLGQQGVCNNDPEFIEKVLTGAMPLSKKKPIYASK